MLRKLHIAFVVVLTLGVCACALLAMTKQLTVAWDKRSILCANCSDVRIVIQNTRFVVGVKRLEYRLRVLLRRGGDRGLARSEHSALRRELLRRNAAAFRFADVA